MPKGFFADPGVAGNLPGGDLPPAGSCGNIPAGLCSIVTRDQRDRDAPSPIPDAGPAPDAPDPVPDTPEAEPPPEEDADAKADAGPSVNPGGAEQAERPRGTPRVRLIFPRSGDWMTAGAPVLRWKAVPCARGYRVEIVRVSGQRVYRASARHARLAVPLRVLRQGTWFGGPSGPSSTMRDHGPGPERSGRPSGSGSYSAAQQRGRCGPSCGRRCHAHACAWSRGGAFRGPWHAGRPPAS